MLSAIEAQHSAVIALCQKFGVRRLDLFGSAATGAFQPGKSDLDFLVEFQGDSYHGMADRYFGLLEALEELFGVRVDLVVASAVKNPYFWESIEKTRKTLYAV
ncbi:MAG: nucleotidyltransferase domain-containing protein [Thermoguttaceae bacterium]|nr:nucleotidyltransferase domain-containing protein [Thermoguttaceae bacterium]MDW8038535.1 nucleotidyltransferase domain-containing protein [Thermoguttaceae bacterium]